MNFVERVLDDLRKELSRVIQLKRENNSKLFVGMHSSSLFKTRQQSRASTFRTSNNLCDGRKLLIAFQVEEVGTSSPFASALLSQLRNTEIKNKLEFKKLFSNALITRISNLNFIQAMTNSR